MLSSAYQVVGYTGGVSGVAGSSMGQGDSAPSQAWNSRRCRLSWAKQNQLARAVRVCVCTVTFTVYLTAYNGMPSVASRHVRIGQSTLMVCFQYQHR